MHIYETLGEMEAKIPTEVLISDRREFELSEAGFIPLVFRKGSDTASFFSANSVQEPIAFDVSSKGSKEMETNYKLGVQLPYTYLIIRLAHYIKVIQRENIGSTNDRLDIQEQLNVWLSQFVADQDGASAEVRARRPLRTAHISIDDVENETRFYKFSLTLRPHFKYFGRDFTLSVSGIIDK